MASKSMDEALEDVGRVLVYDPETRKLCLRSSSPKENARKNSANCGLFSGDSADSGDSGFSGTSSKDISVSSLSSHDIIDEDDIPDLDLTPQQYSRESRSRKLITNLISKLSPANLVSQKANRTNNEGLFLSLSSDENADDGEPFHISLQKRPPNLPPKSVEEETNHKTQFAAIVKSSKKRQNKESTLKRQNLQQKLQSEEKVSTSITIWNSQILPAWPECLTWKRTRALWSQGVPGPIRARLWTLAIGNELNITKELYDISLVRSKITVWSEVCDEKELTKLLQNIKVNLLPKDNNNLKKNNHESSADPETDAITSHESKECTAFQIKLDVSRTFAPLGLFQESGPYHKTLVNILAAYSVCRPDLGYSQGMSFLAAMLLLNLDTPESVFIAFCNLINRHPFQAFYRLDREKMQKVYDDFTHQLSKVHPKLTSHFNSIGLKPEYFLVEQIYTLFSRSLPLESACRIWDLYLLEGEPLIYRASLALLSLHHDQILEMDFAESAKLLTNQMSNFDSAKFFRCLEQTKLI